MGSTDPPHNMTDSQWNVFEVFHQQARGKPEREISMVSSGVLLWLH